ncbi:GNAT family N-acetyltransferase [Candidatus Coxiella mudrowiae]|uniref:GNAT family N-acetyltransferase n=1 Tax=Candidatus Coxiella mudrowiae TaxID=2054173 RepID=UPI001FCF87B4|nr:GNAT family N-acetyltransferase [Candidatus Coxiella mudrowiae]
MALLVFNINNQHYRAEICYDLSRDYWDRGIMTKALRKVIEFCFKKIAVPRIEAITLKENSASIATLKKTGFSWEGRGR